MEGLERRFHSPRDYLELARSPDVTPEQLSELAGLGYAFVSVAVAEHPSTPAGVLERLLPRGDASAETDHELFVVLARHPSTPPHVLRSIAARVPDGLHVRNAQRLFEAGIELFRRADVDLGLLVTLLEDPLTTTEFRKVAARETTRADVLEVFAGDRSERVRRAAARPRP